MVSLNESPSLSNLRPFASAGAQTPFAIPQIPRHRDPVKNQIIVIPSLAALFLIGCAGTPQSITPTGRDTYVSTRISAAGPAADVSVLKQQAIEDANTFAAKQGKRAVPIGSEARPPRSGDFPSYEYEFRLVNP